MAVEVAEIRLDSKNTKGIAAYHTESEVMLDKVLDSQNDPGLFMLAIRQV